MTEVLVSQICNQKDLLEGWEMERTNTYVLRENQGKFQ